MRKFFCVFLAGILLLSSGCGRKEKQTDVALPLAQTQIQEALDLGARNAELSTTEFTSDWTVDLGFGESRGNATIMTPFLRIALLGREATLRDRKVDDRTIKAVLKEDINSITFNVTLFGGYPQFGQSVKFLLRYGKTDLTPAYMFMPPYSQMGRDYTQTATGNVRFNKAGIPDNAKITLIATFKIDPEAADLYTCRFEFVLSKYR